MLVDTPFIEKDSTKLLLCYPQIEVGSTSLGRDQYVDSPGQPILVETEKLPHEPLDSISLHRVSGSLACRDPQPGDAQPVLTHRDGKMFRVDPFAGAI